MTPLRTRAYYTKDCPLKEEGKTLEEAYYTQFGGPFQGGGYRAATLGFYQRNNANPSYQEQRQSMEETLSKFMSELEKRHKENSNMIKKIRAMTDVAVRNQGASIKTLEIQIGQISKVLQERGFGSTPSSTEANPRDHVKSITTVRTRRDRASVSVMPISTYLNLGLGELAHTKLTAKLADRTMKYPKGIAENVLVELRRDQVDDLMSTIEESEVIEEFRARNDARMDKLEYKGNNVVGALMNIPIFVGTFSVLIDFVVLEDKDAYRDEGMGDVIFGEPFFREVGINARWFEGMITIHNGNEEVTYQMVRAHPRFKRHTNEQCNKIPPLLKVSKKDKMNGISHPYQKLKSFYKGVLNLGPEYVRDAKMEEWLTRGHISVHEME
ncbi:hypothetical protein Tco_0640012 [Tanacetum coccineum]